MIAPTPASLTATAINVTPSVTLWLLCDRVTLCVTLVTLRVMLRISRDVSRVTPGAVPAV